MVENERGPECSGPRSFSDYCIKKHAGFKMNPRVKLHFINKLKTK